MQRHSYFENIIKSHCKNQRTGEGFQVQTCTVPAATLKRIQKQTGEGTSLQLISPTRWGSSAAMLKSIQTNKNHLRLALIKENVT